LSLTIERKKIFDELLITLSTIRDVLINSIDLISQEKSSRIAPLQSILPIVYSKISNNENPWPSILRMMMDNDFIKSLTVFIHLCVLNQRHDIFNIIEDILREFLNSFDALIYLVNQTSTPNGLLKALYFAVRIQKEIRVACLFCYVESRANTLWLRERERAHLDLP